LAHGGDKEIVVAIVVVVADSHAHAEHWNGESGFASHICERAVVIVVIKLWGGRRAGMLRPVLAIYDQDVGPAIIVIINKCAAWAHGFRQIFLPEGAVVMNEVNAGLRCNVAKGDGLAKSCRCTECRGRNQRQKQSDSITHY